jgi:hypothetical protein
LEGEVALEAINCGVPIGSIRPSSRIVKDCEVLIDKIQEATHHETITESAIATGK